jgi:crotonobetainyl-CoA:carnitine CoA-transferase CaiB-like acyl-CoA transferase
VIGRPELARDPHFATLAGRKQHENEIEALVTAWTSERDPDAAATALQAAGIPAAVAATNRDLAEDPHLVARGFPVAHEHPEVGRLMHLGVPWKMSASDARVRQAAPCLGADTTQVLRDVCGYSADEIEQLRAAGALA